MTSSLTKSIPLTKGELQNLIQDLVNKIDKILHHPAWAEREWWRVQRLRSSFDQWLGCDHLAFTEDQYADLQEFLRQQPPA